MADANHEVAIDTVREVEGGVRGRGRTRTLRDMLAHTSLHCQRGGAERTGTGCLDCPRLVNVRPSEDGSRMLIRCLWNLDDPVSELMTLANALVTVAPNTSLRTADELARAHGIRHVLVSRDGDLTGIACRCDLVPPVLAGETVADRATTRVWSLPISATLRDAAELMTSHRVGCVPVVDGGQLAGIITRGDLRRAGVDEAMLGATACEACGSRHGVRPHPMLEAVEFCLDCLDRAFTPADYDELGVGD